MSPPHAGHSSGNFSPTRVISLAQAIRDVSWERGRCGLPKRQSRVRRLPTVARVGYSPSRDFSRLANVFAGDHRTASSFHEYVCSVTPIFLTAIGNGLASPHLDFDSRSLWMASSFFPRGIPYHKPHSGKGCESACRAAVLREFQSLGTACGARRGDPSFILSPFTGR